MFFIFFKLIIAVAILLFLPGFFFGQFFPIKKNNFINNYERLILFFALSLVSVNFLVLILNFLKIPLITENILITLAIFSLGCFLIKKTINKKNPLPLREKNKSLKKSIGSNFSSGALLFLIILIFSIVLRLNYLSDSFIPKSTDLGHHMYWAKLITLKQSLPHYGQPDFIIGEHIIFAVTALLANLSFINFFPVVILLLINIFSLLAISVLAYRSARTFLKQSPSIFIASLALLTIGVFYPLAVPQAKYIAGGVVGNIMGNLFIPLILWSLLRALQSKHRTWGFLFILFSANLAFTHHLSTFILLYILTGFILFSGLFFLLFYKFNLVKIWKILKKYLAPFFTWQNISLLFILICFTFFIWTPSYLNHSAIKTAVGTPIKSTRTGLSLGQIILSVGPWRFFYALIPLLFMESWLFLKLFFKKNLWLNYFLNKKKKNILNNRTTLNEKLLVIIILSVWPLIIFLMTVFPAWLKVNIPSNRIVTYLSFPLAILSAGGIYLFFLIARQTLSKSLFILFFLIIIGTGFISGLTDLSENAPDKNVNQEVLATYAAAKYLAPLVKENEQVLKDHLHLKGDTWMKLFFMRGYKFPLSRTYDFRYEDIAKNRETCTRDMIRIPDSEIGQQCFKKTGVKYIVLKNGFDTAQFNKSKNFSKIYHRSNVVIFKKIN